MAKLFYVLSDNLSSGMRMFGEDQRYGPLVEIEWGEDRPLLCMLANAGHGLYGIIVGMRLWLKSPDEKPGDEIMVDPIPTRMREKARLIVERELDVRLTTFVFKDEE